MKSILKTKLPVLMITLSVIALTGCSNAKKQLGFDRNSPDEFTVVKRAPLSLPPSYHLRPPEEGTTRPAHQKTTHTARTAVFGETTETPVEEPVDGEYNFLNKVGSDDANPEIRKILDRESGYVSLEDESTVDKLIFWEDASPKKDPVVNAEEEAARIRKNKESNAPITQGDTPVIQKRQSTIDKIF